MAFGRYKHSDKAYMHDVKKINAKSKKTNLKPTRLSSETFKNCFISFLISLDQFREVTGQ